MILGRITAVQNSNFKKLTSNNYGLIGQLYSFFYFNPPYAVQNVRTQTPVVLSMDQLVVYYMGF